MINFRYEGTKAQWSTKSLRPLRSLRYISNSLECDIAKDAEVA